MRRAWSLLLLICLSCSAPAPEEPVGFAVQWGLGDPQVLPPTVSDIILYICYEDEETCDRNQCSVEALTGMSMNAGSCRPEEGLEELGDAPVLVRRDLRTDVPVSFTVIGAAEDMSYQFVGQAGPMVLGEGERRQIDLFMYPIGTASALQADVRRLLPTTSLLPDGRVLVAGGFESATEMTCPAALSLPMGSRCYDLVATDQALAVDVTTRTVTPIRGRMFEPRGGHSATVLPDGRVLVAGGAPRAVVAVSPQEDPDSGRFFIQFFPQLADGSAGAHASFEVFDAYDGREEGDPERDGDPGAGGFISTGGAMSAGALNAPRFLHAAAAIPTTPYRVVLAGGLGGGESSYEVFDAEKAGGFGVHRGGGALTTARGLPGAVGVGDSVWIFGGGLATSNDELADLWMPEAGNPNGTVVAASSATEFPNRSAGVTQDEPGFSLLRPEAVAVDEGMRPLVAGWYGPQCMSGGMTPQFFDMAVPTVICNAPGGAARRSFTISPTGVTTPTATRPRAYGSSARLFRRPLPGAEFSPGRTGEIAFTGGFANVALSGQASIEVFTGAVSSTGEAITDSGLGVSLMEQRFMHSSTAVRGGGIVTVGGAVSGAGGGLTLVTSVEVVFPPPGR